MKIHNPYLRIFIRLHGTTGTQLSPILWNDWHSIIKFMINISLNIITYFGIFINSPVADQLLTETEANSLFRYFQKANFYAFYPLIYAGSIVSYLIYGHHIIAALDSSAFIKVYNYKRNRYKAIFIFLFIFLFWQQRFILREYRHLSKSSFIIRFRTIELMVGIYIYHATQMTNWYLLFYYQLVTFFTLKQIVRKLWSNKSMFRRPGKGMTNSFSIDQRLFRSIILLSEQSRHLQYYFSYIMLFLLIDLSDSIIGNLSFVMMESFGTGIGWLSLYEQSTRWLLLLALIELNRQNVQLFNHIDHHFIRKFTAIQIMMKINRHHNDDNEVARYTKYNQLKIYRQYYSLSLFNWLNVDYSLLISIFFFSFGYVMLISQTTKIN
uniref:Uncharacterized protein LOC113788459 n=1 Tax=Dermatophagoides pteronyssinus TaxID=6956 RepID=A0A6P6XLR9_DERPT|nr:uncharacterized protein LOC113788459 [Dermatophagoides pteronyssinus]